MSHNCFISFKKEDYKYKESILNKLGSERIQGKALDRWIESDDIDYVMQVIRNEYMKNTSVTIFLIGEHSSEKEGTDIYGDKNAFIKRELQATLYDGKGFSRSGLLGVVLPSMESKIYKGNYSCNECGGIHNYVNINDDTVIKEFSANYYLKKDMRCCYTEAGRFCVLVRYSEFMVDPDKYIEMAFNKLEDPICEEVHWRDLR
jgi:hypothetical protein